MPDGGFITLVNGSPYTWVLGQNHSFQMNAWNFPASIGPGNTTSVYVEFDDGIFVTESDDGAEALYILHGTGNSFQVQARSAAKHDYDLQVFFANISTPNNLQGSTLSLGFVEDGSVNFVLSGQPTKGFWSTNGPSDWMHQNLPAIGGRTLNQLAIPGSHDAGMSELNGDTAFVTECNVLTQLRSIGSQLAQGSRYFDIRPVIAGGQFFTGHYSDVSAINSFQGGNGQSIDDIIKDVNSFTATNKELVILNLSHDLDTDLGNENFPPFTQNQWNDLFQKLEGIKSLFVAPNAFNVDLTTFTLNEFISPSKAAVVIIFQPSDPATTLGSFASKGFYNYAQLNAFNEFSNSNDLIAMEVDQLQKMTEQRPTENGSYFLLSWTLTQQALEAASCAINPAANSILDLAAETFPNLYAKLLPALSPHTYPNIIYVDGLNDTNVAALAVAINTLFPFTPRGAVSGR